MSPSCPVDAATVVVASAEAAVQIVDGEAVIYDEPTGSLHSLNPTATLLWQLLDGSATLGELVVDLAEGFSVSEDAVRAAVLGTVGNLLDAGLVVTSAAG